MRPWINNRLANSSWRALAIWVVVLFGYSYWSFVGDTPWNRAIEAAGGMLPETQPGFPPVEPARSLETMGDNRGDYTLFQALDFPYAFFNLMVLGTAIGLGFRKWGREASSLRFFILAPLAYFIAELIENPLLVTFALNILPPGGVPALIQQAATSLKFGAMMVSSVAALISIIAAALALIFRRKAS